MLELKINPPEGFEFIVPVPRSYMHDASCLLVRFDIKRTEQSKEDQLAELKAKYALDVEACIGIDELEAWELYQFDCQSGFMWTTFDAPFYFDNTDRYKYRRHPHADKIIAYHRCSDEDKQRWECRSDCHQHAKEWGNTYPPEWLEDFEYRLQPKPFFIGKHEVPPPVTEPLEDGQQYWLFDCAGYYSSTWDNGKCDFVRLKSNVIRLTEQDAQTCYEALQATLKGE